MTKPAFTNRRRGFIVNWPVAFSFVAVCVISLIGLVRVSNDSVALSDVVSGQEMELEEQSERIAYLEERLRILEAIEDLQTNLTSREEARLARHVYDHGKVNDISPLLLLAIIQVESSFGTHAVSSVGARGLMQVKPSTGRWVVSKLGSEWPGDDRLFEPEFNLWLGTRYLSHLIGRFGSVEKAIIAYNWGETAVQARITKGKGLPRTYLRRVQNAYQKLQRRYGSPSSEPPTGLMLP